MLEDLFRRPRVQRRIRQNPHGSVLEQFAEYLIARGYSPNTVHQYVFAAEHFGRWLGRRKINSPGRCPVHEEAFTVVSLQDTGAA